MKKVLFFALATASVSLASCGGNNVAEKRADAVEANADADAAKMEAKADSTRARGERAADAIEERADTTRRM